MIQADPIIAEAIDDYLSKASSNRIVSIAKAVEILRATLPDCNLDDAGLAEVIAAQAIKRNCNVSFDHERQRGSFHRLR